MDTAAPLAAVESLMLSSFMAAACALLGRRTATGDYVKGEECLESLKDLQQFLHRDDPNGDIDQPDIVNA
jgi:hypothetical protein